MKDGLYEVKTSYACFGFVVKGGKITQAAPMYWAKGEKWHKIAKWIAPP